MADAIQSDVKRDETGRFIVPPVSPGRPKGSRNKLGEQFVSDLLDDWEQHGAVVIAAVREDKPDQYLKVIASVIPKEIHHSVEDVGSLDDDTLHARFLAAVARLNGGKAAAGRDRAAGKAAPLPH